MLEINHVTVSFPQKGHVLDDLSLKINPGAIVGIIAPNGTGKSTLLHAILNTVHPDSGDVVVDNLRYTNQKTTQQIHSRLCAFPEQSDLFAELSGMTHLQLYAKLWHNQRTTPASISAQLHMTDYIDQPVRTYSLGMKQRLCFAMVLASDAPIMLLDEVMNGLDPINVALISAIIEQLRTDGKLIVIVSHLLTNLQEYTDRALFMKHGKFVLDVDMHANQPQYLKYTLSNPTVAQQQFAKTHHALVFPNGLVALPLTDQTDDQVAQWLATVRPWTTAVTVGPITLAEHFSRLYES
ncbi:MAG: ABC transporter ATP-binding protein [Schleiferilactobacillus perolens]|uniref:ABC transporter ATP-binding protein n=1 Tax=Schleiferilactobacillus perolens TaxID=100468 RepID=UPI0039ED4F11